MNPISSSLVMMAYILLSLSGCAADGVRKGIPRGLLNSGSRRYVLMRLDLGICFTCQHSMVQLVKKERRANEGLVRLVGVVAIDRPAEMELVRQKFSTMDTIVVETEGF